MWSTSSSLGESFSKSENDILSQPMTDLDILDILLGTTSRTNNNNNNNCNNDTFSSNVDKSFCSNVEKTFCSNVRNRTTSCSSIVMDDYQVGGVEQWESGEVVDRSSPFSNSLRETRSEPGTPNKNQDVYLSGDSSFDGSRNRFRSKVVGGKKRGPRPKKLSWEEKRLKRREANDRERQRMGQLNTAFDNLRHLLPKHGNDRELSKFETIQIAKNYIKALNEMIRQTDAASGIFHEIPSHEQLQQQQQAMQFCF